MAASLSILADMCGAIGGDDASVLSLIAPDGDPHSFEPRPSDLLAIRAARLVVTNGLGLHPWMDRMVASAGRDAVRVVTTHPLT
ncbi:MAG: zinc ABC transporter substrate-binding protein, partial [Acetobacteraceae bacterium]|nr:zinc ABC transporter substrate-binding protein [Acetobacteraceae bacterium]